VSRLLLLPATLLLCGVACRSAGRAAERAVVSPDAIVFPTGRAGAPALDALPAVATYAWVRPSRLFLDVTPDVDSMSDGDAFTEQRAITSAVLRANGWREVAPEAAGYHLAVADVSFHGTRTELRPDPRSERIPPPQCPKLPPAQRQLCHEPPPPTYPPVAVSAPYSVRRVTFGIHRVDDGALRWWNVDAATVRTAVPRGLVALLQAWPSPTRD